MEELINLLSEEVQILLKSSWFTTSADVVMKASGLRLEAIRTIAREKGVEIEDTTRRCIDENLLASLADAHVRRLKAYFHKAKRHIAELTGDELATFVEFCKTFQYRQSSDENSLSWSDINTTAIREQFIEKVHQGTSEAKYYSLFADIFNKTCIYSHRTKSIDICPLSEHWPQEDILDKVIQSCLYNEKPRQTVNFILDLRSEARRTTLSARYHFFVSEKDDDHHNGVISKFFLLIHAPRMVV